ncbi:hypothetical protein [Pseudomonas indica]|uniref:hypothetical protein n=1 Tax=Pseudomonas indica TaxID=137658 RepID=UPI000BABE51B|nr:hypothetical protein [Pseudomonas indica]PAU62091.1 hypothetical protein BZL42_06980 [Pseudomonas indica]
MKFTPGRNMAMKVPPHQWQQTVAFYRDVLGLPVLAEQADSLAFDFGGDRRLWIDRVASMSQAELWLEICSDDPIAAARWLEERGVVRCDAIEPLPEGFEGFWIANPAGIVHLLSRSA